MQLNAHKRMSKQSLIADFEWFMKAVMERREAALLKENLESLEESWERFFEDEELTEKISESQNYGGLETSCSHLEKLTTEDYEIYDATTGLLISFLPDELLNASEKERKRIFMGHCLEKEKSRILQPSVVVRLQFIIDFFLS